MSSMLPPAPPINGFPDDDARGDFDARGSFCPEIR